MNQFGVVAFGISLFFFGFLTRAVADDVPCDNCSVGIGVLDGDRITCQWNNIPPGSFQPPYNGRPPKNAPPGNSTSGSALLALFCFSYLGDPADPSINPPTWTSTPNGNPATLCSVTMDSDPPGTPTTISFGPFPQDQCNSKSLCSACKIVTAAKAGDGGVD